MDAWHLVALLVGFGLAWALKPRVTRIHLGDITLNPRSIVFHDGPPPEESDA